MIAEYYLIQFTIPYLVKYNASFERGVRLTKRGLRILDFYYGL